MPVRSHDMRYKMLIECFHWQGRHIKSSANKKHHSRNVPGRKVKKMNYDYLVDASGESCPMPLLKAKQQLNRMAPGECLKVVATDAASVRDFTSFISLTAHELLSEHRDHESFIYFIVKR